MASWISTAATALSTPPDSPQITRPLPTWARILAISLDRKCAMLQSPGSPAMRRTKLPISAAPARRVRHLGVELHGVEPALLVGDGRERRALGHGHHLEAGGELGDAVAVAHPHGVGLALGPHALEQGRIGDHLQLGAAELAVVAALHPAAELRHHGLLAVADAEHRQAGLEHPVRRPGRAELGDAGRPAREDHGLGLQPLQRVLGPVEGHDLGVDALLAHPARDQLGDLAAEVDDEDGIGHGWRRPGAEWRNQLHRQPD